MLRRGVRLSWVSKTKRELWEFFWVWFFGHHHQLYIHIYLLFGFRRTSLNGLLAAFALFYHFQLVCCWFLCTKFWGFFMSCRGWSLGFGCMHTKCLCFFPSWLRFGLLSTTACTWPAIQLAILEERGLLEKRTTRMAAWDISTTAAGSSPSKRILLPTLDLKQAAWDKNILGFFELNSDLVFKNRLGFL